MMGIKDRQFGPVEVVTLDHLVPPDHVYRFVDRSLDRSFVRPLVAACYAASWSALD